MAAAPALPPAALRHLRFSAAPLQNHQIGRMEELDRRNDQRDTVYDWILLGFAIAATIPFVLANGVIFCYRKRKYFQVQGGVYLILGGSIAGLVWISSSFVVNGHFTRKGFFHVCGLWTFWLQGAFGICLWSVCIILRLHRMFLLSKGGDAPGWRYALYVFISMLPIVLFSLVATKVGAYEQRDQCKLKHRWLRGAWVIIVPPYFCGVLIFLFRLRGQKDSMLAKEYMHTCEYAVMASVILLLAGVAYLTKGNRQISGRCFLTFCVCCLVFFHFWVRMGWPVYLCLFKPKHEMDRFEEELGQSGARALQLIAAAYSQRSPNVPSSEGAVLEAFSKATEEVESYKEKIRELESRKLKLQEMVHDLEQKRLAGTKFSEIEITYSRA